MYTAVFSTECVVFKLNIELSFLKRKKQKRLQIQGGKIANNKMVIYNMLYMHL